MSIRAMNWAWSQKLRPVPKLILLALADAADHSGICWPSVPTIARLTEVSVRTVQRELERFRSQGLMDSEPRFRNDGSRTSNRYRLRLDRGGDTVSPPRESANTTECQPAPPAGDIGVRVTTNDPPSTQQLQPPRAGQPSNLLATAHSSCGSLIFPESLPPAEEQACLDLVANLDNHSAQQIVDELAGRLLAGGIRTSPVTYLRSLVARHHRGEFQAELALQIADARLRRKETETRLAEARAAPNPCFTDAPSADRQIPEDANARIQALREALQGKEQLPPPNLEKSHD